MAAGFTAGLNHGSMRVRDQVVGRVIKMRCGCPCRSCRDHVWEHVELIKDEPLMIQNGNQERSPASKTISNNSTTISRSYGDRIVIETDP
jgi:hypothetical protein